MPIGFKLGAGRKAAIENRLEDVNHGRLGKVITYAAGKGAQVVARVSGRVVLVHEPMRGVAFGP